ncbi:MAG: PilZ domain-containing protein [Pseudolabrys sp.]|nr:PilZ domain-containing protein [Pseudolabrys sp.]MDP2294736.1 PilZ domain-containing protein [Pseudolabrys sp.]
METERRSAQRKRTLKSGTISFDRAAGFDCVVRNLSEAGAMLEVESPLGIPDNFTLVIKPENSKHTCRVIWRTAKKIGVQFI